MQNDMRDRLVDLITEAHTKWSYSIGDFESVCADHLIENNVIVPPCKVDDTVYCIYNDQVIQGTVRLIRPFISKEEIIFKGNIIAEFDSLFYDDGRKEKIERYVVFEKPYGSERVAYFTKEQAEQKLKEMREENEG